MTDVKFDAMRQCVPCSSKTGCICSPWPRSWIRTSTALTSSLSVTLPRDCKAWLAAYVAATVLTKFSFVYCTAYELRRYFLRSSSDMLFPAHLCLLFTHFRTFCCRLVLPGFFCRTVVFSSLSLAGSWCLSGEIDRDLSPENLWFNIEIASIK